MSFSRVLATRVSPWLLAGFALMLGAPSASADFTYNLNNPNSALSPYPGPYGTVTVHLIDATHAQITETAGSAGGFFYLFGDGSTLALNTNGAVTVVGGIPGGITGVQPRLGGGTPDQYSSGGTGNVDGQGSFNFIIDTHDGATEASSSLSFELALTSGTWANDQSVLAANNNNNFAAAHIFVWDNPSYTGDAVVTGFTGTAGGNVIPEPSSMALSLAGAVFGGSAYLRRRRRLLALA